MKSNYVILKKVLRSLAFSAGTGAFLLCILFMTGCSDGNTAGVRKKTSGGVEDILQQRMEEEDSKTKEAETGDNADSAGDLGAETRDESADPQGSAAMTSTEGIDIDLTRLSGNMVYSEVYYMLQMPENYMGKTIRMGGSFYVYQDEATGKNYYTCIIQDATACCASGFEFELEGEHIYPDDYPEEGSEIEVTGIFDTYEEDGDLYCILRKAAFGK